MAEKDFGRTGGFFTVGVVKNVKDDPTQTGKVRVQWQVGGASQSDLNEDDLPWTQAMFPASNPLHKQTGGPVTGLQIGSVVYGIPIDGAGQEYMIIGSAPKSGNGSIDSEGQYDADVPQPGKVQDNNGEQQPKYGDVNSVVTQKSIWKFGETEGGEFKKAAKYPSVQGSIGYVDSITEEGGGGGGAQA